MESAPPGGAAHPVLTGYALAAIERGDAWLDAEVADVYKEQPLAQHWGRVAKIAEECGEVVDALIRSTGQNPRKGVSAMQEDVLRELADVVMTGLLAMQHLTKDVQLTSQYVSDNFAKMINRVGDKA